MLPHLQTMHYDKELFLMSWLSPETTIELYTLIKYGHPTCINIPLVQNHSPRMYLINFVKYYKIEHGQQRQLALKLSKGLVAKLIPLSK
jgi:hypothetical protein